MVPDVAVRVMTFLPPSLTVIPSASSRTRLPSCKRTSTSGLVSSSLNLIWWPERLLIRRALLAPLSLLAGVTQGLGKVGG